MAKQSDFRRDYGSSMVRLRLAAHEITARVFLQNSPNDVYYHLYAIETFSFLIFFVPLHLDYGNFRKYDRITDSSHFV